jgi:clan AA aspartic protease
MGETRVQFEIYGPEGKSIKLEALVDTAATFTKVPESVAVKLGLKAQYEAEVELGDGRILKRRLALAEVEIEGVRRPVLVAIGGEGERALLGYTTLEILGFKVNPVTGKLEKAVAIEYLETMACGTPVITSNALSLPEVWWAPRCTYPGRGDGTGAEGRAP